MEQGDAVPVFTSRDRVDQGAGANTYTKLPIGLLQLCDAWPNDELALVVNPGTSLTVRLPGAGVLGLTALAEKLGLKPDSGDFQPGAEPDKSQRDQAALALSLYYTPGATLDVRDEAERALLEAASTGDREAFLRALFAMDDGLRLPVARERDPGVRYSGHQFPWQVAMMGDRTVIQTFTSPQRQREVTGVGTRSSAVFADLLRYWPDPSWDLAVNAGTPIGALLSGDEIATLSEWCDQYLAHRLSQSFPAPPTTERIDLQLLDAGRRGDRRGFLEILRPARVWVVSDNRELDSKTAPTDPAFPWTPVPVRGRPSMQVFTGTYWRTGSGKTLLCRFGELVEAWPQDGPDLVLNPASPISITMTADEVHTFATGS